MSHPPLDPRDLAMIYLVVDGCGSVRRANECAARLLQEVGGSGITDLVPQEAGRGVERLLLETRAGKVGLETVVRLRTPPGGPEGVRHAHLVFSRSGADVVVQGWDVSALVRQIHDLELHAHRDPLTGLANRTVFMDRLGHEIARSARSGTDVAVLFADVDSLKAVNDTYGHEAGDRVLTGMARRLTESLRPEDTLARMGGDEFAVVCADLVDPDQALAVAHRLREAAAEPIAIRDRRISVTLSVGVAFASADADADDPDSILRRADAAMYTLKRGAAISATP